MLEDLTTDINGKELAFKGDSSLKQCGAKLAFTKEHTEEFLKCSSDWKYFIEKYHHIISLDDGITKIKLRPYQLKLIENYISHRFNIVLASRQCGKTESYVGFILHYILFNENKSVAILANKLKTTKGILQKVKQSYSLLPKFIQQGVKTWNKTEIVLENGCSVFASATTGSSIRSGSANIVIIDECAFIQSNTWTDFYESTYPTISSSKESKVIMVSCVIKDTFVFSDKGLTQIKNLINPNKNKGYEVEKYVIRGKDKLRTGNIMYNNGLAKTKILNTSFGELECSLSHKLWSCVNGIYGWHKADEIKVNDFISLEYNMNIFGNNDVINFNPLISSNRIKNTFKCEKIDKDIAYFLGLFISKGYCEKIFAKNGKLKDSKIVITSEDSLETILNKLNLTFSCRDEIHYIINSTQLMLFFEFLGFDFNKKENEKLIPDRLLQMSKENIIALLQGIFDGNGDSKIVNGTVSYTSESKTLVYQVKMLLLNLGLLTDIKKNITLSNDKVHSTDYIASMNTYYSKIYYDLIGFRIERKQIKRDNLKKSNGSKDLFDLIPYAKKILKLKNPKENIKWFSVNEISYSENEVYDFSLPDDDKDEWCHSVLYNGYIGHQTPNGMNHFYKFWEDSINKKNVYKNTRVDWWEVPGRDEKWKEETIANTSVVSFAQEFGNDFCGSVATLIDPLKLKEVKFSPSLEVSNIHNRISEEYHRFIKIYKEPIKGHIYSIGVDSCKMTEENSGDALGMQVIDITKFPYEQVATFFAKEGFNYLFAPEIAVSLGNYYNSAYMFVENNEVGQEVANAIHFDYEYENIYFEKGNTAGYRTTKRTKRLGCTNLKLLIEKNKIILNDFDTISQLSTFIKVKNSFKAENSYQDDLVMALISAIFFMINKDLDIGELEDTQTMLSILKNEKEEIEETPTFGVLPSDEYEEHSQIDIDGFSW
ncbi:hypothetical protein GW796_05565 [archaeon]|nr:hypothetical protein [archaeon]NCQ51352.1 hypothetical protein [archaeon]NCT58822.1 hypothetical protein [archaeon]